MPLTPEAFIVDPQGMDVEITVLDLDDGPVSAYAAQDDTDPISFPVSTSVPTIFWFEATDPPQIRSPYRARIRSDESATDYQVSVILNETEIAGDGGTPAVLEAHSWIPFATLAVSLSDEELTGLIGTGGSGSGLEPTQPQDVLTSTNADYSDGDVITFAFGAPGDDAGGVTVSEDGETVTITAPGIYIARATPQFTYQNGTGVQWVVNLEFGTQDTVFRSVANNAAEGNDQVIDSLPFVSDGTATVQVQAIVTGDDWVGACFLTIQKLA